MEGSTPGRPKRSKRRRDWRGERSQQALRRTMAQQLAGSWQPTVSSPGAEPRAYLMNYLVNPYFSLEPNSSSTPRLIYCLLGSSEILRSRYAPILRPGCCPTEQLLQFLTSSSITTKYPDEVSNHSAAILPSGAAGFATVN
ncbi:hypothetical protein I7I51_03509 [Histoplasma capsulatum]|uniref:Uncharacterized protein n=1 Tax=Ajellomyces capsulatus TaxID=5037 RepID=A0A8A1M487_AJECA|nr:hypothetical protein I7I51_03509 [Histoplasma capsulatum]